MGPVIFLKKISSVEFIICCFHGALFSGFGLSVIFRPPWIFSTRHDGNVSWKKKKKKGIMLAVDAYHDNILHTFQLLAKRDIYCLTEIKDSGLL